MLFCPSPCRVSSGDDVEASHGDISGEHFLGSVAGRKIWDRDDKSAVGIYFDKIGTRFDRVKPIFRQSCLYRL